MLKCKNHWVSLIVLLVFCMVLTACSSGTTGAKATNYPSKPINVIVPFAAGDTSDLSARTYGEAVGIILGQPLVINNKPGAGGSVGGTEVARAKGDGYTLLTATFGMITVSPYLSNIAYTHESFKPVAQMADTPLVVAVKKDSGLKDMKSLVEFAKSNPGKVKYGTPGSGTIQHLTMEGFAKAQGIKLTNIPFEGGNRAVAALLGGHVDFIVVGSSMVTGQYKAGEIRLLGVTAEKRLEFLPDVMTFKEQGHDVVAGVWFGILAPNSTPDDVVKKLSAAYKQASEDPKVLDALKKLTVVPAYLGTDEFSARIKREAERNQLILKDMGLVKK
jgi:tripartite-type tricarboxylate transporter receptor subunit TctC